MIEDRLDVIYDIPFEVTLNTGTVGYDVNIMEKDKPQNLLNNGIVRDGGLTEVYQQQPTLTNPSSVYHTSNGHTVHIDSVDHRSIYVDNVKMGLLNCDQSFSKLLKLNGYGDCSISATGTYLCLKHDGITFILDEIDDTGTIINTKTSVNYTGFVGPYSAVVNNSSNTFANTLYVICVKIETSANQSVYSIDFATGASNLIASLSINACDQIAAYYVGTGYIFSIYSSQPVDNFLSGAFPVNGKSILGKILFNNSSITTTFTSATLYSGTKGCGYITKSWYTTPGTLRGFGSDSTVGTHGYSFAITYAAGAFVFTFDNAGVTATAGAIFSQNQFAVSSQVVVGGNVTILPVTPQDNLATGQAYSLQYACDSVGSAFTGASTTICIKNSGGVNSLITLTKDQFEGPGIGNAICSYGDIYNMCKICHYKSGAGSGKILFRNLDGNFTVVQFGNAINYSYSEISPGVVQISSASKYNIIDANNRTLNVNCGSFISSELTPYSFSNSASGVTVNYFSYNNYSQCVDNGSFLNCALDSARDALFLYDGLIYYGGFIDIIGYINGVGKYIANLGLVVGIAKVAFDAFTTSYTYIPSPYEPIPITSGYDFRNELALLNNGSAVGVAGLANYDGSVGYLLQKYTASFRLFGQLYAYDGVNIYNIPLSAGSSGAAGTPVIVTIANGLRFLCVTPQAAVFVSDYDNTVFSFDGGRDVSRLIEFNQKPQILSAAYNVANEEIIFKTESTLIFSRSGIISEITAPYTPAGNYVLQESPTATWAVNLVTGSSTAYFYKAVAGGVIIPLVFQSAYYGFGSNKMKRIRRIVIRMLFNSHTSSQVNIAWNWITDVSNGTSATAVVTPATDSNGYAIIDYNPYPDYVLGGSLSIWSTDATQKKVLLSITAMIHPDADAQTLNHAL